MRRAAITWLSLLTLACTTQDTKQAEPAAKADAATEPAPEPEPEPEPEWQPTRREPKPEIARKDLVAEDLPEVPTLETLALAPSGEGEFALPEGTDELAPRAAVALRGGLLLAGQAYFQRRPGRPSPSWRWLGFVASSDQRTSSTKLDSGAVRAAVADGKGGAFLTGTHGIGFDARGWFGAVDGDAQLGVQVDLDSPNTTEMFDVLVGATEGELALVGGYVDAQGWLVSLDAKGEQRWQKFIGSYGYTQIRGLARRGEGREDLLAIGSRAKAFGESWWAKCPGDGGAGAAGDDVEQDKLTIEGADPHQLLRAIVDLGDAGFVALGTAKKNYLQAHDQLVAVGFDRDGAPTWSKVVPDVRVTDVFGGQTRGAAAVFVVAVPSTNPEAAPALALVELSAAGPTTARQLDDSEGWASAGFVDGAEGGVLLSYAPSEAGIKWRQSPSAK
ncbi:hypothetical protein ENSA5_22910 [Enhygromyxa salina]|uniref:Uncharacterized protein n=1 Tax=Enhygromyxa salina TaxID=215803 RepID=A0A2S9YBJ6_9BACT|nr:hypothetical protein [Enhygromyxa salina]PRQ02473.1 hypothetical protein ENSA5_22910 [Enhygromyxa salina]